MCGCMQNERIDKNKHKQIDTIFKRSLPNENHNNDKRKTTTAQENIYIRAQHAKKN